MRNTLEFSFTDFFGLSSPTERQDKISEDFHNAFEKAKDVFLDFDFYANLFSEALTLSRNLSDGSSSKVSAKARAVVSQAKSGGEFGNKLLAEKDDLFSRSRTLEAQMKTNSLWKSNPAIFVSATLAAYEKAVDDAKAVTSALQSFARKVADFKNEAKSAYNNARAVDDYAQGKGASAIFENIGSGFESSLKTIGIAAVIIGGLIIFLKVK